MTTELGIRSYDHVELYVGSAKAVAHWHIRVLGLEPIAYQGPETGSRDRVSYALARNNLRVVITGALRPECADVQGFVSEHGDGVRRWAVRVDDAERIYRHAVEHGAVPSRPPTRREDDHGGVTEAAIRLYDTCEVVFLERVGYSGPFLPGYGPPPGDLPRPPEDTGLLAVDHIVGNVRVNEMDHWAGTFERALGFEPFIYFGPGDISTPFSALLSRVVRSPGGIIKNPINEPYPGRRKSQIQEYLEEYRGSGIQHVAISCQDIVKTVAALRRGGAQFLHVPDEYYDALAARPDFGLTEDIADLKAQRILCDVEGSGYLLQLFTQPVGDRPTFFYEVIQRRKGASGFGQGNFQALFESIEAAQERRGNL